MLMELALVNEIPEAAKEIMREMGINPETWEY